MKVPCYRVRRWQNYVMNIVNFNLVISSCKYQKTPNQNITSFKASPHKLLFYFFMQAGGISVSVQQKWRHIMSHARVRIWLPLTLPSRWVLLSLLRPGRFLRRSPCQPGRLDENRWMSGWRCLFSLHTKKVKQHKCNFFFITFLQSLVNELLQLQRLFVPWLVLQESPDVLQGFFIFLEEKQGVWKKIVCDIIIGEGCKVTQVRDAWHTSKYN